MPTSTVGRQVEHAHLAFTLAVHRALTGGGADAACWSPFSVASALGLAAAGARGTTRAELTALLLGVPDTGPVGAKPAGIVDDGPDENRLAEIHNAGNGVAGNGGAEGDNQGNRPADNSLADSNFAGSSSVGKGGARHSLADRSIVDGSIAEYRAMLGEAAALDTVTGADPPVLGVTNTLWTREDIPVRPEFTDELGHWPNGSVRAAPFQTQPETARRLINTDVAETTRGLIPQLLAPGSIMPGTVATLVNALYLKVAWRNRFPDRGTERRPFGTTAGTTDVPTMRLDKRLGYTDRDGWQVVVLPAAGDVDAVVLLPSGDLTTAEAALDADTLAGLLTAPVPTLLDLYLPKFTVRVKSDLNTALGVLGVRTMFTDQADFGGISERPLAVSSVRHEAVLTIDEQGLEGAAATAVVMRALALQRNLAEPIVVRVDRPFLFLVRHRPSGAVYFLTRVTRP